MGVQKDEERMLAKLFLTINGNEATARMAHKLGEVIAIYLMAPSSARAELADSWSSEGKTNPWGSAAQGAAALLAAEKFQTRYRHHKALARQTVEV